MDRFKQILQQIFATGYDVGLYRHAGQHRSINVPMFWSDIAMRAL